MQWTVPESPAADTGDIEKCLNTAKALATGLHRRDGHLGFNQIPDEKSCRTPALPNPFGQTPALIFVATNKEKSRA
jgi:hypothetical protein